MVQRGGDWAGPQPAQAPPRCTKCNSSPINAVSTASVHQSILLYNGLLLCSFNVPIKGLTCLALRYLTADDFRPVLSLNTTSLGRMAR